MPRVHHFDAVTMCPLGGGLLSGGALFRQARLVCHCLLVETNRGLVLVDTGLFAADEDTARRIDAASRRLLAARGGTRSTALRAIEALGFAREDVRHVIVTHLDVDHAGGLPDFPDAEVHLYAPEHEAAVARRTLIERRRYVSAEWAHDVKWRRHDLGGDTWKGFQAVRPIEGLDADVAIVPLVGHTLGHAGIAVRDGDDWLLHAGDAYFHEREITRGAVAPPLLELFQTAIAMDLDARRQNLGRLRLLAREHSDVRVFCAHSPEELERARAR